MVLPRGATFVFADTTFVYTPAGANAQIIEGSYSYNNPPSLILIINTVANAGSTVTGKTFTYQGTKFPRQ
jgi:hypothetical protein